MYSSSVTRRSFFQTLTIGGLAAAVTTAPAVARTQETAEVSLWRGLELQDKDGRTFQVGDGRAPLTLVTMWAHWCPACLIEMPSLVAMAAKLGPQVEVVLLSHPEYWPQDQALAQRQRLPFRQATATRANGNAAVRAALMPTGVYEVPRTLAFRGRGTDLAWSHLGSMDWASASAIAQVRALVG